MNIAVRTEDIGYYIVCSLLILTPCVMHMEGGLFHKEVLFGDGSRCLYIPGMSMELIGKPKGKD